MLTDTAARLRHTLDTTPPPAQGGPAPVRQDPHIAACPLFARLAVLEDGPERDAVRSELVALWLPMAYRIAGRFRDKGEDVEDLRQVAAIGLIKSINRYVPARGAFESYAIPTIVGEVKRHFRDHTWAVRVPRRVQELRNQVRTARRELTDRPGGRTPSTAELAENLGLTEDDVTAGMRALECYSTTSLDFEVGFQHEGFTFGDTLGNADPAYDLVVDREAAKDELRKLPEQQRTILYMRFFQDMTQTRIAEALGISQMHVSRLITRSCTQVRDRATAERNTPPATR
ncbi:SigB/SigF/SigG family RNA polymerase sigma factor [Streptomyces sp. NPDC060085]|uniref:SigB/SigF/SigG family RNA polymerase sigma factor n=1 Tax=Streptomyces sp. NPDC060085 TaxID=3347054 RepID=UPI0036529CC6